MAIPVRNYDKKSGTHVRDHMRKSDSDSLNFSQKDMPAKLPKKINPDDLKGGKESSIKQVKEQWEEFNKQTLSEQEVNLIKSRLNSGRMKVSDLNNIPHYSNGEGFKLTADQINKGKAAMLSAWKSATGKERANNPFGYREQAIIEKMKEIRLRDFYNTAKYGQPPFYVPLYEVTDNEDDSFQYAFYGGQFNILG